MIMTRVIVPIMIFIVIMIVIVIKIMIEVISLINVPKLTFQRVIQILLVLNSIIFQLFS